MKFIKKNLIDIFVVVLDAEFFHAVDFIRVLLSNKWPPFRRNVHDAI